MYISMMDKEGILKLELEVKKLRRFGGAGGYKARFWVLEADQRSKEGELAICLLASHLSGHVIYESI